MLRSVWPPRANTSASVDLQQQFAMSGQVADSSMQPIGNATIEIYSSADHGLVALTSADSDGAFTVGSLAPGTYDLVVSAEGYQVTVASNEVVSSDTMRQFVLTASTTQVSGRMLDSEGHAISDGDVQVVDAVGRVLAEAKTGSDGTFAVSGVSGVNLR